MNYLFIFDQKPHTLLAEDEYNCIRKKGEEPGSGEAKHEGTRLIGNKTGKRSKEDEGDGLWRQPIAQVNKKEEKPGLNEHRPDSEIPKPEKHHETPEERFIQESNEAIYEDFVKYENKKLFLHRSRKHKVLEERGKIPKNQESGESDR